MWLRVSSQVYVAIQAFAGVLDGKLAIIFRLLEIARVPSFSLRINSGSVHVNPHINKTEPCVHQKFDWRKLGFALKVRVEREVELPV